MAAPLHPTIVAIEDFLDDHVCVLPATFHGPGDLVLPTHRDFWRALILTYSDRYGSTTVRGFEMYPDADIWEKPLKRVIQLASLQNKRIRARLALRMDTERVQMQRPLRGRSLLSITTSRSSVHSRALRSLVVMGVHPTFGVDGFRVAKYGATPFVLPKSLQDVLPTITPAHDARPGEVETGMSAARLRQLDLVVNAPKMTGFVHSIYAARAWIKAHPMNHACLDEGLSPFIAFVHSAALASDEAWRSFGTLPDQFLPQQHGFVVKVPYVIPGRQVILWSTWHATAGASPELATTKMTAFVDLVPKSFFAEDELHWYQYACSHAPMDPGAGSGRGAYLSFIAAAARDARSAHRLQYGLPDEYMQMFDTGLRNMATDNDDRQGLGTLTSAQKMRFFEDGYLILAVPQDLVQRLPVDATVRNFSSFFRYISGDHLFDLDNASTVSRVLELKEAERETGSKYTYFTRRVDLQDPLNPFAEGATSHNPHGGGKLITKDCGMGMGTTYVSEPFHVAFQYSSFVYNVLSSFYSGGVVNPLVVVLERFRVKTTSVWSNGTHVDNVPARMISMQYHAYRSRNNMLAFL